MGQVPGHQWRSKQRSGCKWHFSLLGFELGEKKAKEKTISLFSASCSCHQTVSWSHHTPPLPHEWFPQPEAEINLSTPKLLLVRYVITGCWEVELLLWEAWGLACEENVQEPGAASNDTLECCLMSRVVGEQNAVRSVNSDSRAHEVAEDPTETYTTGHSCQILLTNLASVCFLEFKWGWMWKKN